ncbi:MAG TPA: substrate-binding domain-containing protein [Streptosporangiaceae bacterium]
MINLRRPRLPARRLVTSFAAGTAVLLAAACGSSASSSNGPASGGPASGGSASGGSTPGGSASSGANGLSGADQAGLAKAQAFLAQVEARPTQITSTVKVVKPVPKGKTVYFITCGASPECTQEGPIVQQADSLLGWKTVILNNDGTPQQWKSDFDQVVRAKPAAVLYSAIPQSTFASEIPALKANGTFIAGCCVTDAAGSTTGIGYANDVPSQIGPIGGAQAAFVAADSKDTANSLIVNLPSLPILTAAVADYKAGMAAYCPSCKVSELDIALANIANAPATIAAYLRSHPSINYVVAATDGLTIGLPAALKNAGLSNVKIVGQGATPTNLQYLHSGQQAVDVAFPYYEALWSMVTAAAQNAAGVPVTPSVAPPLWVLTPSNAPDTSNAFPVVLNYKSQYEALWGL